MHVEHFYYCDYCHVKFENELAWQEHEKICVSKKESAKCGYCESVFKVVKSNYSGFCKCECYQNHKLDELEKEITKLKAAKEKKWTIF